MGDTNQYLLGYIAPDWFSITFVKLGEFYFEWFDYCSILHCDLNIIKSSTAICRLINSFNAIGAE